MEELSGRIRRTVSLNEEMPHEIVRLVRLFL